MSLRLRPSAVVSHPSSSSSSSADSQSVTTAPSSSNPPPPSSSVAPTASSPQPSAKLARVRPAAALLMRSGDAEKPTPWWLRLLKWLALLLLTPLALALVAVWWLMARPGFLALLDLGIVLGCYLQAASNAGPVLSRNDFFAEEKSAPFDSTLFDVLLVVIVRSVLIIAVTSFFRYRSIRRALFVGTLVAGVSAVIFAKLSLFGFGPYSSSSSSTARWSPSGSLALARAVLIAPLVIGFAELVSEFWIPTSYDRMMRAELSLLSSEKHQLHRHLELKYCAQSGLSYLESLPPQENDKPALVLIHGFFGGKSVYVLQMADFAQTHRVYSLDWLGIGGSDRPRFRAKSPEDSEEFFLEAFEQWRVARGINKFSLLGHSFGGYLAAAYALRYPQHMDKLVLASPVGVPEPEDGGGFKRFPNPTIRFILSYFWSSGLAPQSIVRFFGPLGPWVVRYVVKWRFGELEVDAERFADYLYHINAGPASGERALTTILAPGVWAHRPLASRLENIQSPVGFFYGTHDWMTPKLGEAVAKKLNDMGKRAYFMKIPDAGHQLFLENHVFFNQAVLQFLSTY